LLFGFTVLHSLEDIEVVNYDRISLLHTWLKINRVHACIYVLEFFVFVLFCFCVHNFDLNLLNTIYTDIFSNVHVFEI